MKRIMIALATLWIVSAVVVACAPAAPAPGPVVKETVLVPQTVVVRQTVVAQPPLPSTVAPPATGGRLATIKSRGKLICGVNDAVPGFSALDKATGQFSGFDADYCRAVAAAVYGDATKVEFRAVNAAQRGPALQTGEVDLLIRNTTWTVSRDTSWGLFAPTTFYDGQGMLVNVKKNPNVKTLKDLKGASICVQTGTTTELNLTDAMRVEAGGDFKPVVFQDVDPTYQAYEQGRCDAVTSDRSQLIARRSLMKPPEDNVLLDVVFSKEPLGPVVPLGDDQWFNVVKWVVYATIQAEEDGVTSKNVDDMAKSTNPNIKRLLTDDALAKGLGLSPDWVQKVIKSVGNYAEIFDRNLGPTTPFKMDRGPNKLWTKGGLLYAPPYR